MSCLHNLSRQGRTIIFSIHQPRYSIFKLFDTVLFLSSGHNIYLGRPIDVLPYFASNGFICEEHNNPADFILDILMNLQQQDAHRKFSHTNLDESVNVLLPFFSFSSNEHQFTLKFIQLMKSELLPLIRVT